MAGMHPLVANFMAGAETGLALRKAYDGKQDRDLGERRRDLFASMSEPATIDPYAGSAYPEQQRPQELDDYEERHPEHRGFIDPNAQFRMEEPAGYARGGRVQRFASGGSVHPLVANFGAGVGIGTGLRKAYDEGQDRELGAQRRDMMAGMGSGQDVTMEESLPRQDAIARREDFAETPEAIERRLNDEWGELQDLQPMGAPLPKEMPAPRYESPRKAIASSVDDNGISTRSNIRTPRSRDWVKFEADLIRSLPPTATVAEVQGVREYVRGYQQSQALQHLNAARMRFDTGDYNGAAELVTTAYSYVPDGQMILAKGTPQGVVVAPFDERTGQSRGQGMLLSGQMWDQVTARIEDPISFGRWTTDPSKRRLELEEARAKIATQRAHGSYYDAAAGAADARADLYDRSPGTGRQAAATKPTDPSLQRQREASAGASDMRAAKTQYDAALMAYKQARQEWDQGLSEEWNTLTTQEQELAEQMDQPVGGLRNLIRSDEDNAAYIQERNAGLQKKLDQVRARKAEIAPPQPPKPPALPTPTQWSHAQHGAPQPRQAPPEAIEALRQRPEMAPQFRAKYGYLPGQE